MASNLKIRRALVSVSDKRGLDVFARFLHREGVEIISTGGTAAFIAGLKVDKHRIPVTRVEEITGFPEIMDGRVKTLHPKIHAGLLARRDVPEHAAALEAHGIGPIDLLVVNLYPFEKSVEKGDVPLEEAIENIDIGGPAMIRAAAKNHEHVVVVTDPGQYPDVIEDYGLNDGCRLELRRRLAAAAFARTAAYDAAITNYLFGREEYAQPIGTFWGLPGTDKSDSDKQEDEAHEADAALPWKIALPLTKVRSLRYGENPHQAAGLYRLDGPEPWAIAYGALATARQLHGKPLSYNNLLDANAALGLARDLFALDRDRHAAVVVKHTNPCGAAVAGSVRAAVDGAMAGDPLAAYGGILATTSTIDVPTAERLCEKGTFLEVVIARGFEDEAVTMLMERWKNLRLLRAAPEVARTPGDPLDQCAIRSIDGGFLVQERDTALERSGAWTLAAGPPTDEQTLVAAEVVWTICKHLSSNAVAIGGVDAERRENGQACVRLFGAGAGQMDRVASCRIAVEKAGRLARESIAASDAFFPFPDGPELLIGAGVRVIVQPGGSKRDEETFRVCQAGGVSCYTTGVRHFRH